MKKVSIIIPTFNQAFCITRAIESALAQDYLNLEVVVADDASTDETAKEIHENFNDERLVYFCNETNLGRVSNYRKALYDYASGDWALNLDGDDYLLDTTFISTAVEQVNNYNNVVAVIGGQRSFEATGECRDDLPTQKAFELVNGKRFFLSWDIQTTVPHLGIMYSRHLAISHDFYRFDILSSDWESLRRLILKGNVVLLGRVVGAWIGHPKNASANFDYLKCKCNLLSVIMPYKYALKQGLSKMELDCWLHMNVRQLVRKYTPLLVYTGGAADAIKFVLFMLSKYLKQTILGLLPVILNFRFLVKFVIISLGGTRLLRLIAKHYSMMFSK